MPASSRWDWIPSSRRKYERITESEKKNPIIVNYSKLQKKKKKEFHLNGEIIQFHVNGKLKGKISKCLIFIQCYPFCINFLLFLIFFFLSDVSGSLLLKIWKETKPTSNIPNKLISLLPFPASSKENALVQLK